MIKETRQYVQGGTIAERTTLCDVCGAEIPKGGHGSTGWAYVQETKTPTQTRLMIEQGGRDEFQHICLKCWEEIKHDHLRPKRDGTLSKDVENVSIHVQKEELHEPNRNRKDRRR